MNGEQLCYMHGFVHRSLLYSIDCSFRLYRLLPVVPFTAHHFYFSSSTFVFHTDVFVCLCNAYNWQ